MKILSLEKINQEFIKERAHNTPHSQPVPQAYPIPPQVSTTSSPETKPQPISSDKSEVDRLANELYQLLNIGENESSAQKPIFSSKNPETKPRRRTFRISTIIISFCAVMCVLIAIGIWTGSFGYSLFQVTSGSMQREIPEGSLVITKRFDTRRIITGDTITYRKEDGSTVTHKVVNVIETGGMRRFRTQGTENPIPDSKLVNPENVVGLVVYHAAGLGSLLVILKGASLVVSLTLVILAGWVYIRGHKKKPEKAHRTQTYKSYAAA